MERVEMPGSRHPDSYEATVYPYLLRGESRQTIEEATRIAGDRLTHVIKHIRARYLGKLTPERQALEHRQNTSAKRGGIWLAVRDYFPLDLTSRQTQVALEKDHNLFIEQPLIARAYMRERHRHGLQRPIAELTVEAQRDKKRSKEELLGILRRREAAQSLMEAYRQPKPKTLQEWSLLEAETDDTGIQLLNILGNEELIPADFLGRRYLFDLYEARMRWIEGDRSLIDNFPTEYEEIDPTIIDRLEQQRGVIVTKVKPKDGNKRSVQTVEAGEVKQGETGWG